jgi:lauroyl/myristoyl acyltransferase
MARESILMKIVEDIGKLIFRLVARCADVVPNGVRESTARACALFQFAFSPQKRKNVTENISRTGKPATVRSVLGIFALHSRNIIEIFSSSLWKEDAITRRFEMEGKDALDQALAEGKGAILVTAHIGSWELGALYLQALGLDLHVVAGVQMNRLLTGAVKEAKEKRGIQVINPDDSYRKLIKALAANAIVALLVDGNIYSGGTDIAFFGARARVPDGPLRLARASGAPIVGGYCRRLDSRRCKIHIERIMKAHEIESMSERDALNRVYGTIERFIGQNADQWCMFRRFWENPS